MFAVTVLSGAWLINVWLQGEQAVRRNSPSPLHSAVLDPYDTPLLQDYRAFRNALINKDVDSLAVLAQQDNDFLAYRASLVLGRWTDLDPSLRLEHYRRAAELRVDEPLARQENREFLIEMGAIAEAAGERAAALEAYGEAMPHPVAVSAVQRLESDPYRLSNLYLQSRLHRKALDALGGRAAPSIEAPAHQALGEHKEALAAFERWLDEQPASIDARYGEAWSHYYLGNLSTSNALFETLPGENSLYARALIARRNGDLSRAVDLMLQTGSPSRIWLASSWLEAEDRYREALDVYLHLAEGSSSYTDDAAYRALVLAGRVGDSDARDKANQLLPEGSFFALRRGSEPLLPDRSELPSVRLPVQELALELARLGDFQSAVGELVFALQDIDDEAAAVSLAETLQMLGEFRQSQRAAQRFVSNGSREVRTWRAAYPRAYSETVLKEAAKHDLEPELLWAIMRQESAFYPKAVSFSNAAGLMQVIPSTWDWLAELQKESPDDPFDPVANIRYGSYYVRWLMNYHDGDAELVIPSYNRGQGYIRRLFEGPVVAGDKDEFFREIDALETREYLQRVTVNYRTYKALYQAEGAGPQASAAEREAAPEVD